MSFTCIIRKIGFLSLSLLFVLLESAFAQPPQRRALPDSSRIATMVDTLAAQLALSDSVKSKVSEIYFASYSEMGKAFEKNRGDFRSMRDARRKIIEKRDVDIKALLSDEQKKAYDKILQKQREEMQKRMRARRRRFQ